MLFFVLCGCGETTGYENPGDTLHPEAEETTGYEEPKDTFHAEAEETKQNQENISQSNETDAQTPPEEETEHVYTMGSNYSIVTNVSSKGYTVLSLATGGWVVADAKGNIVYDEFRSDKTSGNISLQDEFVIFKPSSTTNGKILYINIEDGSRFELPQSTSCGEISEGRFFVREIKESLSGTEYFITCYDTSFQKLFSIEAVAATGYRYGRAFILDKNRQLWIIDQNGNKVDWDFSFLEAEGYFYELHGRYNNPVLEYVEGIYADGVTFSIADFGPGAVVSTVSVKLAFRPSPGSELQFCMGTLNNAVMFVDGSLWWYGEAGPKLVANQDIITVNSTFEAAVWPYGEGNYFTVKDVPELSSAAEWHIGMHAENAICVDLESKSKVSFSAIIDAAGQVLCAPTRDFIFYDGNRYSHYNSFSGLNENCYFSDGLCPAFSREKSAWGYINTAGQWVIEPQYKTAGAFVNGYATVVLAQYEKGDFTHFIINPEGKIAWGNPK